MSNIKSLKELRSKRWYRWSKYFLYYCYYRISAPMFLTLTQKLAEREAKYGTISLLGWLMVIGYLVLYYGLLYLSHQIIKRITYYIIFRTFRPELIKTSNLST
jgi:hypothetical protein